jgi:hypothetical protein
VKLEYLEQAQATLSKCGAPVLPGGITAVPILRSFIMPMSLDPGGAVTFQKEITGRVPWELRAISSDQASASLVGIRMQIQLPNGRFLFGNNGIDVGQFAWVGSWRWLQDPGLRCEPGSKIQVTLTDTTSGGLSAATPVNLLFEGAFLHFVKGGEYPAPGSLASALPRYQGILNENILAPAWMSGEGLTTPDGFEDTYFIYSTPTPEDQPAATTWTVTGAAITTPPNPLPLEIQVEQAYDHFFVRRMLFDVQVTDTASAIVLGKLRTGAGYVLNDNYIDLARYLGGAEFAGQWKIRGGDSIFIDVALADVTGTGTVTFQVHLEGFKRRKI